jgi:DNA-binding transcriptional MerR regulator
MGSTGPGYTAAQTARLTGCTTAQLRSWDALGLVRPGERAPGGTARYSFRDLVALRVVSSLLESGLAMSRIRRALRYLVESGEDVAGLRLVTDGETVWACRDDGEILDALRQGQLALFVSIDGMAEAVAQEVRDFDRERNAFVAELRKQGEDASGASGGAP